MSMLIKWNSKKSWILLLVLASLWLGVSLGVVGYGIVSPASDFQDILRALEMRGTPPPLAVGIVQQTVAAAGPLRRVILVGYYSGITKTFQLNTSHLEKKTQASYIAWFDKIQKPMLLLLERHDKDGALQDYIIAQGEPMSIVGAYLPSLLLFAFSLYMVCRKKRVPAE
jgi:hypothetical protein